MEVLEGRANSLSVMSELSELSEHTILRRSSRVAKNSISYGEDSDSESLATSSKTSKDSKRVSSIQPSRMKNGRRISDWRKNKADNDDEYNEKLEEESDSSGSLDQDQKDNSDSDYDAEQNLSSENESYDGTSDESSKKDEHNNLKSSILGRKKSDIDSTLKLYTKCRTCGVYTKDMDKHQRLLHEKPYKCDKCKLSFRKKALAVKHKLESHATKKELKCHYCWETFKDMSCLVEHNKEKHKGLSNRFSCDKCGKPCQDNVALSRHKLVHTNRKPHKCEVCDKSYVLESTLKVHLKNHFENKNEFKCSVCSKHFTRRSKLRDHELTHREDKDTYEKWTACPHLEPTYVAQNNNFPVFCKACNGAAVCTFCGFAFKTKQHYMAHTHNNFCTECGMKFFDARFYNRHVSYHSANSVYKCELCKYGFETLVSFGLHKAKQHSMHLNKKKTERKKVFQCKVCGKEYATHQNVQFHMKLTHEDKKGLEFKCDQCDKQFVRKTLLTIHKRKHDKLECQKFKCDICPKGFSRKTDLNRHVNSHSSTTPFSCDICGVCVKSNRNLQLHMDTHKKKSFICKVCKKSFAQMCYLKNHMQIHENSKPHQCKVCMKSFLRRQALDEHMPTHTGKSKYQCEHCQQYFCSAFSLRKHVLNKFCLEETNEVEFILS